MFDFAGQVPGYGSLNFQVVPEERGIYEDFRVGGLQPTRSMG